MAEYLRAHPEHSAEDFRIIKELSDELLHTFYLSDKRAENYLSDRTFETATKHIASSELGAVGKPAAKRNSFALLFRVARACCTAASDSCTAPLLYCIFHQG